MLIADFFLLFKCFIFELILEVTKMRIEQGNSIGLVIDIQERLFSVMHSKDQLLERSKILIEGLQILSVPLLFTQQYSKGLGETHSEISSLIENFSAIEKSVFSCYDEPTVVEALEESDNTNVIICGIEAHVCVLQTAIDLKNSGYTPIIVVDCISSRKNLDLDIALLRYQQEGILVTSSESILFELTRSSKAPEFRSISKLVK